FVRQVDALPDGAFEPLRDHAGSIGWHQLLQRFADQIGRQTRDLQPGGIDRGNRETRRRRRPHRVGETGVGALGEERLPHPRVEAEWHDLGGASTRRAGRTSGAWPRAGGAPRCKAPWDPLRLFTLAIWWVVHKTPSWRISSSSTTTTTSSNPSASSYVRRSTTYTALRPAK